MKRRLVALAFAAALPAAAQTPAPAPSSAQAPQQPAAQPGTSLNLKLNDPARYTRETPRDGGSADVLPSLGGDARSLPARDSTPARSSTSPYPQDTNPNR